MLAVEVRYDDPDARVVIARCLREALALYAPARPAVLCLGTDRYLGDSFGPLVGTILVESGVAVPVLGTLQKPVTAEDLPAAARALRDSGSRPILVVDAMLGKEIGVIRVGDWPMRPAMGRAEAPGELRLAATVAEEVGGYRNYVALAGASLGLVVAMARVSAAAVLDAFGRKGSGDIRWPGLGEGKSG